MKMSFGVDGVALSCQLATTVVMSGSFAGLNRKPGAIAKSKSETLAEAMYTADGEVGMKKPITDCTPSGTTSYANSTPDYNLTLAVCNCTQGSGAPADADLHDCHSATKVWGPYGTTGVGGCTLIPCLNLHSVPHFKQNVAIDFISSASCTALDLTTHYIYGGVCDE